MCIDTHTDTYGGDGGNYAFSRRVGSVLYIYIYTTADSYSFWPRYDRTLVQETRTRQFFWLLHMKIDWFYLLGHPQTTSYGKMWFFLFFVFSIFHFLFFVFIAMSVQTRPCLRDGEGTLETIVIYIFLLHSFVRSSSPPFRRNKERW